MSVYREIISQCMACTFNQSCLYTKMCLNLLPVSSLKEMLTGAFIHIEEKNPNKPQTKKQINQKSMHASRQQMSI